MSIEIKMNEHTLDNGLKVLFNTNHCSPSATFMVWYKVGSRNEKPGKTGISHFLEHISFKKTELFDKGQIVAEITRNGGHYNAYTARDFTCYFETFATSKLELAMLIESQRMNKVIFDEDDREKEVGVILSELEKSLDNPYSVLEAALRNKAYDIHPYKNPVIGWGGDIEATTSNNLREYYEKYYAPNNASIVVVGNFEEKATLELIKKHFGDIEPKNIQDQVPMENIQTKIRRINVKKSGYSPIIKLAYHIPPVSNKDIYPLAVLGEMMNLGISSRAYQSLVETQIATDVSVNVEISKDPGLFSFISTLYPGISHEEAEKRVFEEFDSLVDGKPPTEEELKKTKRRIKSSFEFNRDGNFKLAYLLGYYETINNYNYIDNYINNIEEVTIDDVKNVVKRYLNHSNCCVGHFIPAHAESNKLAPTYDYVPHETIHHIYETPPIIIDEKITSTPVKFTKKELDNGLKVLISQTKTSDTVKLFGTVRAGNIYQNFINPVTPVMCAGMLNRGSVGMSKIEIAEEVETRGASVGISNVGEAVNFSLSSTREDFPYILSILAKILMEPTFPEDEFEKYQKFAIAGVRQKKDDPGNLAAISFSQNLYPKDHIFYNYSLKKQEEQILTTTLNEIKTFYETFYAPNTTIFGIAGNVDPDKTIKLMEDLFRDWKSSNIPDSSIIPVKLKKKSTEKIIKVKDRTEAEVIFGHFGNLTRMNPDFHKAMLMNFILGGSGALSSRIGKRIREDLGLVYSISSAFTALLTPGAWAVKFGVDVHYADMAIEELKKEIIRFIEDGMTDSELDLAKSYLIGSYPLKFSNNSGIARSLLVNEFYELGDDYFNQYPDTINAISKDEVNETAKKYLHPEIATIIKAGNFK